jgi:hypothetical protein
MATDTTEPHGQASLYAGDVCNTRSPKLINIGSLTKVFLNLKHCFYTLLALRSHPIINQGKWPFEAGLKSTNCWCAPDGDNFRVRGSNYLHDRKKVPAGQPFAELVAVDWFVDYQRIDNICSRPSGTCQHSLLVYFVFFSTQCPSVIKCSLNYRKMIIMRALSLLLIFKSLARVIFQ